MPQAFTDKVYGNGIVPQVEALSKVSGGGAPPTATLPAAATLESAEEKDARERAKAEAAVAAAAAAAHAHAEAEEAKAKHLRASKEKAAKEKKNANSWIMQYALYESSSSEEEEGCGLGNEPVSPADEYTALAVALKGHIQAAAVAKKDRDARAQKECGAKIKSAKTRMAQLEKLPELDEVRMLCALHACPCSCM